jgi:hypothetical protein
MAIRANAEEIETDDLLVAMDDNLWSFWRDYGRVSGAELHETADLRWFATGIPLAVFNGVPYSRLSEADVDAALVLTQASVDRRRAPAMWWTGPNTRPIGLGERLERRGLAMTRMMIGMVVELGAIRHVTEPPGNFRIERVCGTEMRRLWAQILAEGSGFPEDAARSLADLEPTLPDAAYVANPRYIGFLSDRPVATSVLVLAAGLAGIYAVATIPDARRCGVGSAMTALPLLEARAQGYQLGMLQATVMGHSAYKKLGFREICQYRCYSQTPSTA